MAKLIRIGMPINGHTRRFAKISNHRFIYSCPSCTGLNSNDQAWCVCGLALSPVANLYLEVS